MMDKMEDGRTGLFQPRFAPGRVCATPHLRAGLDDRAIDLALTRHLAAQWGDLPEADREENDRALAAGHGWLLSLHHLNAADEAAYSPPEPEAVFVATRPDRSETLLFSFWQYGAAWEYLASRCRFHPGEILCTQGVQETIPLPERTVGLWRHMTADWGDLAEEDRQANDWALRHRHRLFSAYHTAAGEPFWVVTEADYAVTTALLPEEY